MASNHHSTFQSSSYSFSSSTVNGSTQSYSETMYSDASGTKVHRISQDPGQAPRDERIEFDSAGRRIQAAPSTAGRVEDVTEQEQSERDRQYEERIEDEYAKKEGGA